MKSWVKTGIFLSCFLGLSACDSGTASIPSSTKSVDDPSAGDGALAPTVPPAPGLIVSPTPSVSVSPSPSPSPMPSVSPSPSPSVSPTPYAFHGGDGTMAHPYLLETALDVQKIEQFPSAYFSVTQDIDMSGFSFHPLAAFSGTLYGNNHHLYNLTIITTGSNVAALFVSVSGTLVQLVLQNIRVTSATFATGFAGDLTGMLSSCSVSGDMTSPSGGNGFNTGIGNPTYVTNHGGTTINSGQSVMFNGNRVNQTLN